MTGPAGRSLAPLPAARQVLRLPRVAAYMRLFYLFFSSSRSGFGVGSVNVFASADAQGLRAIDRPLMVAGRLPDPGRPFDAAVNGTAAQRLHLSVGSRPTLYGYSEKQLLSCGFAAVNRPAAPAGPRFMLRVAGIVRLPSDVSAIAPLAAAQDVDYEGQGSVFLTPAFLLRYAAALGVPVQDVSGMNAYDIRLRGGLAGWDAFGAQVMRLDHATLLAAGGAGGGGEGLQVAAANAERGTQLAVVALVLFGALAGLVTLLLAGQALARQVLLEEADLAILAGLGMSQARDRDRGGGAGGADRGDRGRAGGSRGGGGLTADAGGTGPPGGDLTRNLGRCSRARGRVLRHRGAGGGTGRAAGLAGEPPRARAA